MEFWNQKILHPPATCSFEDKTRSIDVKKVSQYLIAAIDNHTNLYKYLETEAALMSRCIYRMKMKFRKDKGLKALEKINRAVKQYSNVDILQIIKTFHRYLPTCKENETNLPTRNLLDYLLVRILGVTKLCIRIAEVSKECAAYMENKISIGHFWKVAVIALAISARMWCFMKEFTNIYCTLYQKLLSARKNFQNIGQNWLPQDFELPSDIRTWSGCEIFNEKFKAIKKEKIQKINFINEVSDNEDLEISKRNLVDLSEQSEDIGEMIEKEKLNKNKKKGKNTGVINDTKKTINNQSAAKKINNMKDFRSIVTFVKEENNTRKGNKEKCIFKNIDDQKWEKMLSFINKHEKKGTPDGIEKIKKLLRAALKE